jgi:hypothetical protein
MRLVMALLLAGVLSLLAGIAAVHVVGWLPCHGEGLACNLDQAIGAYAVPIAATAGLILFAAIVLLARPLVTLRSGLVLLLTPLAAFTILGLIEVWTAFGLQPYPDLRQALNIFVPAALTVITQWLILRWMLGQQPESAAEPLTPEKDEAAEEEMGNPAEPPRPGGVPLFPTE